VSVAAARKRHLQRLLFPKKQPSDGLEPSTPSLPSSDEPGTRGHGRVTETKEIPQVGPRLDSMSTSGLIYTRRFQRRSGHRPRLRLEQHGQLIPDTSNSGCESGAVMGR
jgi:hypothetical protein